MRMTLASVLDPAKYGYYFGEDRDTNWNNRGNRPLDLRLSKFETCGDGLTQHSGAWCAQLEDFTDACLVLSQAIIAAPQNELWRRLEDTVAFCHPHSRATLQFAGSVVYEEGKRQWFNARDNKVSRSESKRNDRRWEEVGEWCKGNPRSALRILAGDHRWEWFKLMFTADELREVLGLYSWPDIFPEVESLRGDWSQAMCAMKRAILGSYMLRAAESVKNSSLCNSVPKESVAA